MPRKVQRLLAAFSLGFCLAGASCSDDPNAPGEGDFGGYWDFQLTIAGSACPGDGSGQDCFRIHQQGSELFIVDDLKGNLTGSVSGGVARISRATPDESVYLELRMLPGAVHCEGFAIEADSLQGCTTELDLLGTRRASSCN